MLFCDALYLDLSVALFFFMTKKCAEVVIVVPDGWERTASAEQVDQLRCVLSL